jgi:hypothetical protein
MNPSFPVAALVSLNLACLPAPSDELCKSTCMSCGSSLDLHQPESEVPDRLLGTCPQCQRWYILDFITDEAVIVSLPEAEVFLKIVRPLDGHRTQHLPH